MLYGVDRSKTMAKKLTWNDTIRKAIRASGLSLYAVAQDSGVNVAPIQRFMAREHGLTVDSAEKVGRVVGLELRRMRQDKRKGGAG
jgi:ribosome-binding protein aMBF1 (putative translation factor)